MSPITSTVELLEAGIKAEHLRQKAIASNMANLETPGYRRVDIKFEEVLAKAIDSEGKFDPKDIKPELYNPKNTSVRANGNDVTLESEVGQLVENSLRHEAYVRLLNKKYKQMEMALQAP
ncbi:MAG: flagellar basal body rod protein FlgB [Sedimentisphaerales bacterium]|nr:flagellar basal body rod protein FlgB [Sedimentisphaerales bacterium]